MSKRQYFIANICKICSNHKKPRKACDEKLAELIKTMNAEIAELKKGQNKGWRNQSSPLKIWYAVNKEKGFFIFCKKTCYFKHIKTEQNPLAKQDRIEQDFDSRLYLICKVSKSKDFLIDFDEGGRSRIQILQARIWRKIRKRLLLGCSIRSCLAKWSNMWSRLIF